MNEITQRCGQHLVDRIEPIVDSWRRLCDADDELGVAASRLTRRAFKDGIPLTIKALGTALSDVHKAPMTDNSRKEIGTHGQHRWKQGFSLREIIRDWGNLHTVLLQEVDQFFQDKYALEIVERVAVLEQLSQFVKECTSESVQCFDELRQRSASGVANELSSLHMEFEATTLARTQMLREAAHDLRGGLAAISGASEVLRILDSSNESYLKTLASLDRGVASVKTMLNSLLDLSRLESGQDELIFETVDMAPILESIVLEYRSAADLKALSLTTSGPDSLLVEIDVEKVRRIVQNLLVNAIDYTPQGGVILSWTPGEDSWTLRVEDTGVGMSSSGATPLANSLQSDEPPTGEKSRNSGEGIGLTIVKRLCEALGAGIELQSSPEAGSTFEIEFPLAYSDGWEVQSQDIN